MPDLAEVLCNGGVFKIIAGYEQIMSLYIVYSTLFKRDQYSFFGKKELKRFAARLTCKFILLYNWRSFLQTTSFN
jgi:hypothetical protein